MSVVGSWADERIEVLGLGGPMVDAAHLAPARCPFADLDRGLVRRVVGEADPGDAHAAVTSLIRSSISAHAGPAWKWTRNSRLPSGPRIGEAITALAPRPSSAAARHDPLEHLPVDGRVPDDAVVRPAPTRLELRLDEGDDRSIGPGRSVAATGPRTSAERDERDVDDGEAHRLRQRARTERSGVRPLHRNDPLVAAKRFGELAPADVDGVHTTRAALEEDVREAAGRCPGVQADATRRVDPEGVQRRGELVAAATDVRIPFRERQRRRRVDEVAGLAVEAGRSLPPPP